MPSTPGSRRRSVLRNRLSIAAGVLALLLAAYAAAGYWLAPRLLRDALVDLAARHGVVLRLDAVHTDPFTLRVRLDGIELLGADGRAFAAARRARAELAWSSLQQRMWIVEQARLEQPRLEFDQLPERQPAQGGGEPPPLLVREAIVEDGALRFAAADLALEALRVELHNVSTAPGASGRYRLHARIAGGRIASHGTVAPVAPSLALRDVVVEATGIAYAGIALRDAVIEMPQLAVPPAQPVQVTARASLEPQGEVSARGSVGSQPLHADLQVELDALALPRAQRWLPAHIGLKIVAGALSANGRLRVAQGAAATYAGSVAVRDLRLDEGDAGQRLLGWQLAEATQLKWQLAPNRVEIAHLLVQAPQGRLVREADGGWNVVDVFGAPAAGDAGGAASDAGNEGAPLQVAIGQLRIEQGTLHFADRALETPFEATIEALSGEVAGIDTAAAGPARVTLGGRVQGGGEARIGGTIDLGAPKSLADIEADFRNLRLPSFNPYAAKFAGYRIASGRLAAQLHYEVRDGRLQGDNKLVFEQLQLGEKLDQRGVFDLPLELAIALLADAEGRIDLRIPVRGDLDDPKIDLGGVVAEAIGEALRRIVSAPFRAIASVFGGDAGDNGADSGNGRGTGGGDRDARDGESAGGGLAEVRFDAGSAALAPPAERHVARIARVLEARPRLAITVRGGYAAGPDLQALRLHTAQRDIAQQAGVSGTRALDFGDPKVLQAAEQQFMAHAGSRLELQALRAKEQRYGPALVERLAAVVPADKAAPEALAGARAQSVRAALLAHGVDASRVRVQAPLARQAGEQGVPTVLALAAVAGGTGARAPGDGGRRSAAEHEAGTDRVRRVQRQLHAEGFAAGPVDGILGPATRRALAEFQRARGLPVSAAIDSRTSSALAAAERAGRHAMPAS